MQTTSQVLTDRALDIFQKVTDKALADTAAIRSWLADMVPHAENASPMLMHLWGALTVSLLETTVKTNKVRADDGRFVANYLRAIETKDAAYLLMSEEPAGQIYRNGFSLGYPLLSWGAKPLYENTRNILTLLSRERRIPVVANLYASQNWNCKNVVGLMEACEAALGKKMSTVNDYLKASKSMCMAGVANALIHSAWRPTATDVAFYKNAWDFALLADSGVQNNADRVRAMREKLPRDSHKELFCLYLNKALQREEVNLLFPLDLESLGTKAGLTLLVAIYTQQEKNDSFRHAVELFKAHHPVFALLVETHLMFHTKGDEVLYLIAPWANAVNPVPPESYSVSDLVL